MWPLVVQIVILLILTFVLSVLLLLLPAGDHDDESGQQGRAQILVLGDIARSPRMRNHATSLARHGVAVDLVGYTESELPAELERNGWITVQRLPAPPPFLQVGDRSLFIIFGPLKVTYQTTSLFWTLCFGLKPAKWLLLQNPPSIPTLAVATLVCYVRNTKLAIDWHNYGYSILALKLGREHPLVKISFAYEKFFSSFSALNLTVSEAMRKQLQSEFHITAPLATLYDRPTAHFAPISPARRMEVLKTVVPEETQWDLLERGQLKVVASSTSWTADEDFGVLLDALVGYSALATGPKPSLPELCVVITGKGPQKAAYLERIAKLERAGQLEMVTVRTPWFPAVADYAQLLAAADLGVSLHTSSSGVDLPMKVVDMLGAGIPVAGWSKYESWSELVQEGKNGKGFQSSEELRDVLVELMGDGGGKLAKLRAGALKEGSRRWEEEWDECAGKLLGITS